MNTDPNCRGVARAPSPNCPSERLNERLIAGAALAFLHAPMLLWLQDVWSGQGLAGAAASMACPVVVAGLLFLRRSEFRELGSFSHRFHRLGAWVMVAGGMLAAGAAMFQELMLLGLSLPISVFGYLAWTRGVRRVLPLAVPIAMLAFLVPVTQATLPSFSHSLQLLSAEGATAMLQLAGLPATRAGVVITTGITTNTVTQDCSGLATLQALLLYGLVMGFVFRLNARRLAAMVGVLLVLSLAVNAARVAFISWLLYTHGVEVAEGPLHNGSGYVLFAVAYSVSFALTLRLAKTQPTQSKMNAMIDQSPVSA